MSDEKEVFDHVEGGPDRRHSEKHGDRALSVIGGERVTVTAEEVCYASHELYPKFLYQLHSLFNMSSNSPIVLGLIANFELLTRTSASVERPTRPF